MLSGAKLSFSPIKVIALALAIALTATVAVYSYHSSVLSAQLAEQAAVLVDQEKQIVQFKSTIASQQGELADKESMLQIMDLQIATLEEEINSNEQEIAAKTAKAQELSTAVESQKIQLQMMQSQALELQNQISTLKQSVQQNQVKIQELQKQVSSTQAQLDMSKRIRVAHYGLGVTEDGQGVVFPIEVEIIGSGEGTISLDVKNVQYEASFQDAVRTAAAVASDYTGESISDKDIIVRFVNDDDINHGLIRVDGGSAGALVAGMIAAGLTDRQIAPSTLLTGTIKSDGSVGQIGGLESKADAAAEFGAKRLLVPDGQKFWHESMTVVEVSNIDEVMRYLAPG